MLNIVSFCWGRKYGDLHARRLFAGVMRNLDSAARLILVTDSDFHIPGVECVSLADPSLTHHRGCFARLRLFDPAWFWSIGVQEGERVVCMDLDNVITGPIGPLFNRPEPFAIFQAANAANPCPYNGSLWMLRAGYRPDVWSDFSLDIAAQVPHYEFPDDQAWFASKLPNAAGWKAGSQSGVYGFHKPGWPGGDDLPKNARMVCFFGKRDPSQYKHLPWMKEHWRC